VTTFAKDELFVTSGISGTIERTSRFLSKFTRWRNRMTKFKVLGAVCLAATLAAASPALARPGGMRGAAHVAAGGGSWHGGGGGWHGGGFRRGGFGPGIAAGVIAGAALGGAYGYYGDPGYYGDSYAYDPGPSYDPGYAPYNNGYNGPTNYYNNNPNGFVCQPGTVFKGEDGRPHLCQ
jgi:hypothetical protein